MDIAYDLQLNSSGSVWEGVHELCIFLCSFGLFYKSLFMSTVSPPVQEGVLDCSTQSYKLFKKICC